MTNPRFSILMTIALLAACSDVEPIREDMPDDGTTMEAAPGAASADRAGPPAKPVRIGELGPRFPACDGLGVVIRSEATLRNAPFENAAEIAELSQNERVHVCTRSMDQQWVGVIISVAEPDGSAEDPVEKTIVLPPRADKCGVMRPASHARNYDGPCRSGWVEQAAIRRVGR